MMNDFKNALMKYQLWVSLGWNDVLGRYRRSVLGPFWITISMAVTISAMGPLYGSLFGASSENFIMHLSLGMIFWAFMSSSINDSCSVLNDSSGIVKQSDLPFYVYILRVFYRQLTILFHNCIIIPVVILITHSTVNFNFFLIFPAMIVTSLSLVFFGMMLCIFCTRYRDMGPVVQSIVTLCFFVTPIIWSPEQLTPERRVFVNYNIFYYYIEILRKPLMGQSPEFHAWFVAIITTIILMLTATLVLAKFRSKIVYWL